MSLQQLHGVSEDVGAEIVMSVLFRGFCMHELGTVVCRVKRHFERAKNAYWVKVRQRMVVQPLRSCLLHLGPH